MWHGPLLRQEQLVRPLLQDEATGDPVGTPCNPEADTPTCEGYCIHTDAKDDTRVSASNSARSAPSACTAQAPSPSPGPLRRVRWADSEPVRSTSAIARPTARARVTARSKATCAGSGRRPIAAAAAALGAPGVCYLNVTGSVELTCGEGGAGGEGGEGGAGTGERAAMAARRHWSAPRAGSGPLGRHWAPSGGFSARRRYGRRPPRPPRRRRYRRRLITAVSSL
jgi:hypothetical protein